MTLLVPQAVQNTLVTPTFTACTASDTFAASPGQSYLLYYINGATATGAAIYVSEKAAVAPSGSVPVTPATPATKWSDLLIIATTFPANQSRAFLIPDVTNFLAAGVVNLLHGGTLTTLTVAVLGPC